MNVENLKTLAVLRKMLINFDFEYDCVSTEACIYVSYLDYNLSGHIMWYH